MSRALPRLIRLTLAVGCGLVLLADTAAAQTIIDTPTQAASIQTPYAISGWAAYPSAPTGTGIDQIAVWATPQNGAPEFWGYATYGGSRPDVGAALGDARFTPSGYTLLVSGHAPGNYHVIVYARIAGTETYQAAERDVTILATPLLTVNAPAVGGSVTSPFDIWGWAFDGASPSGVGIDAVHLYAYPNPGSGAPVVPLGAATLGLHRPDVGGFFQNAQFNPSGWSLTVASGTLPAGQYLLIVYAHSTVNNAWIASTRILYVDQPTVTLTIDRAGGGTGGVTSNPSGLSCAGGASTQAVPCATSYPQTSQTPVTLTATADAGSVFTGWSGACSGTGACQVTMSLAQHVVATFQTYTTTYYHLDPLGSVRAITDSQAVPAVIATHTYQPFGEDTAPLTGDPIRFTGKELDAETALQYFGARYYRNRIGRFMSVDPGQAGAVLGVPQSWNPYAYAGNNPLRFVDLFGLDYLVCSVGDAETWSNGCDWVDQDDWDAVIAGNDPNFQIRNGQMWALVNGMWKYAGYYEDMAPKMPLEARDRDDFEKVVESVADFGGAGMEVVQVIAALQAVPVALAAVETAIASTVLSNYTREDFVRRGYTIVSRQLVDGPGARGAVRTFGLKGGGTNPITGAKLPFHYHIHRYNWSRPWLWFRDTPIIR